MLLTDRYTVGVFGDPHLMTFRGYQLQTCEITGIRDYLVNRFFRVTGSAEHVRRPAKGSALTELTVSFYDGQGEVSTEYSVRQGHLPSRFTNGQDTGLMTGAL
jgi:hypothetical protein